MTFKHTSNSISIFTSAVKLTLNVRLELIFISKQKPAITKRSIANNVFIYKNKYSNFFWCFVLLNKKNN